MNFDEYRLRLAVVDACRRLDAQGLSQGTSGNVSVRHENFMLVTPSGVPSAELEPGSISRMRLDAVDASSAEGPLPPSSEWRFHRDILVARPRSGAVVHMHSTHACALAMARRPIPACHYMVAAFGGADVRCSDYARYGTEALSRAALRALEGRDACLLANHGAIVLGDGLAQALWRAVELETIAHQYLLTLAIGGPVLLRPVEIEDTLAAFAGYGLRQRR